MKAPTFIRRWFSRRASTPKVSRPFEEVQRAGAIGVEVIAADKIRRFGAAMPNRLNRESFAHAQGQSINADLATDLPVLMARCGFEFSSNSLYEGVCNTFKDDVVGRDGPLLQVVSDDETFNVAVEDAFKAVFADPDPSHRFGGVELMKTWVHGLLNAGSYYNVYATVRRDSTPITFGWRSPHARRFVTPPKFAGDQKVAFGCRYDDNGAAIEFYIDKPSYFGPFAMSTGEFETIPASAVQHCFIPIEGEQLTGYPMMTTALDAAADIRDSDKYIHESIKNSAANSPGLEAKNPTAITDPDPAPDCLTHEPGQIPIAPKGWGWTALTATQPGAEYLPFRRERAAELGRPIHMPLLVVLLTAAEANFSTAQYEGTVYTDGVEVIQGFIERRSLNPIVMEIVRELVLKGRVRMPRRFSLSWTHNKPAHANIEKQVKALRMMLEDGAISLQHYCAAMGYDYEKVQDARESAKKDLDDKELPPLPTNSGNPLPPEPDESDSTPPKKPPAKTRNARFTVTN